MKRLVELALVVALVTACGNKKEEPAANPPPAGSATAGSGSAPAPTAPPPPAGSAGSGSAGSAAAAADVPTEMDFEDEAKANITAKNVETELKQVEQELGNK